MTESSMSPIRPSFHISQVFLGPKRNLGWRLENIVFLELLRRRIETDTEICYYPKFGS